MKPGNRRSRFVEWGEHGANSCGIRNDDSFYILGDERGMIDRVIAQPFFLSGERLFVVHFQKGVFANAD